MSSEPRNAEQAAVENGVRIVMFVVTAKLKRGDMITQMIAVYGDKVKADARADIEYGSGRWGNVWVEEAYLDG